MNILHIAHITDYKFNGVNIAVPLHVKYQGLYAKTALLNINDYIVEDNIMQFSYGAEDSINVIENKWGKIDLVVFHECYRLPYLKIAKHLINKNIPYIIAPHGELRTEAQKKKKLKKVIANMLLFNWFIRNSIGIQCLSPEELNATKFEANKFIATNGVEIPIEIKREFSNDGVQFIYIGRYEWYVKGLDLLFDAIRNNADILRKEKCLFKLFGPDLNGRYEAVKALVLERNIEDLVTINLEISGKEKKEMLLKSDIFIQTSRHEGMPMGILEAMSYGIPCIVTKGTSLADIVEGTDSGWNAGETSSEIGDAILKSIQERNKWINKGNNALETTRSRYSWEKISQNTIGIYEKLIGE